jgi:hypothetical protein
LGFVVQAAFVPDFYIAQAAGSVNHFFLLVTLGASQRTATIGFFAVFIR